MFETTVACAFEERTWAAHEPPGVILVAALDALKPGLLDDDELLDLVAGWERIAGWVRARQADAVAVLAGRPS